MAVISRPSGARQVQAMPALGCVTAVDVIPEHLPNRAASAASGSVRSLQPALIVPGLPTTVRTGHVHGP